MIIFLLLFQQHYTGNSTFVYAANKGFYPGNLKYLDPFVLSAVFNTRWYNALLAVLTPIRYGSWTWIFRITNDIALFFLLIAFASYLWRKKATADTGWEIFILVGGGTSVVILALLSYLSVRIGNYYPPPADSFWTHVSENRYFIFDIVYLLLLIAGWLFIFTRDNTGRRMIFLRSCFVCFLCAEILHGTYTILKKAPQFSIEHQAKRIHGMDQINSFLDQLQEYNRKQPGRFCFVSDEAYYTTKMALAGIPCVMNCTELNEPVIRSSQPVLLIAAIGDHVLPYFNPFLEKSQVRKIGHLNNFSIYVYQPGAH